MLFSWLRRRRRQKLIAQPFPEQWLEHLQRNVPHYNTLSDQEQARLRDDLRIFMAEKEWEGCGGLELTDEIRLTIAAFACLLTLGMREVYFDHVITILVYPDAYVAPGQPTEGFLIEDSDRVGEAHYRGPVVLSWAEVAADAHAPELGRNVVIHEFAHQLDMLSGWVDGTPPLPNRKLYQRWAQVMPREYKRLIRAAERGQHTLLDDYGAENEAEFFAVSTECFFTHPKEMRQQHRELYQLLADYFNQDPAHRSIPWEAD